MELVLMQFNVTFLQNKVVAIKVLWLLVSLRRICIFIEEDNAYFLFHLKKITIISHIDYYMKRLL